VSTSASERPRPPKPSEGEHVKDMETPPGTTLRQRSKPQLCLCVVCTEWFNQHTAGPKASLCSTKCRKKRLRQQSMASAERCRLRSEAAEKAAGRDKPPASETEETPPPSPTPPETCEAAGELRRLPLLGEDLECLGQAESRDRTARPAETDLEAFVRLGSRLDPEQLDPGDLPARLCARIVRWWCAVVPPA